MTLSRHKPVITPKVTTPIAIVILVVAALCAGCMAQPAVPQDYYYRLPEVHLGKPGDRKIIHGALAVDLFQADGIYRERPILYIEEQRPLEVMQYHYRHWIQTPSQLIQDNLVDYLRLAKVADHVERYSGGAVPKVIVKGRLERFERLLQQDSSVAMVQMEIELRKTNRGDTVKRRKTYQSRVIAKGPTIHDSVLAFGEALEQIYTNLLSDLEAMGD